MHVRFRLPRACPVGRAVPKPARAGTNQVGTDRRAVRPANQVGTDRRAIRSANQVGTDRRAVRSANQVGTDRRAVRPARPAVAPYHENLR